MGLRTLARQPVASGPATEFTTDYKELMKRSAQLSVLSKGNRVEWFHPVHRKESIGHVEDADLPRSPDLAVACDRQSSPDRRRVSCGSVWAGHPV